MCAEIATSAALGPSPLVCRLQGVHGTEQITAIVAFGPNEVYSVGRFVAILLAGPVADHFIRDGCVVEYGLLCSAAEGKSTMKIKVLGKSKQKLAWAEKPSRVRKQKKKLELAQASASAGTGTGTGTGTALATANAVQTIAESTAHVEENESKNERKAAEVRRPMQIRVEIESQQTDEATR